MKIKEVEGNLDKVLKNIVSHFKKRFMPLKMMIMMFLWMHLV